MDMRKILFWVHLISGVSVGLVILFLSVTGMMLAFRPQIIAYVEKNPSPTGQAWSKDNPSQARTFLKKVESWHRYFGVDGKLKPVAHNIKGVCTSIFLGVITSGFYLWWPRKTFKFKPALRDKARDWNRHNVIGFWFAPVLIVIVITGLLMLYLPSPPKRPPLEQKVEMAKDQRPQDTPLRKFKKLVKTIHTGEAGGILGQSIVFLASGGAVMLVWTGLSMAWRRFFSLKSNMQKESYV